MILIYDNVFLTIDLRELFVVLVFFVCFYFCFPVDKKQGLKDFLHIMSSNVEIPWPDANSCNTCSNNILI